MHYFETVHRNPGDDFPTATAHASLEEAMKYADQHNAITIYEIGGGWLDLRKCDFCKEWIHAAEMKGDLCLDCLHAIEEHAAEELKIREENMRKDYRIRERFYGFDVEYFGMQVLDGWASEGWHTVASFTEESEAQRYIDFACKCLT